MSLRSVLLPILIVLLSGAASTAQEHVHRPQSESTGSELFTTDEASGTSLVPADTPMHGVHWSPGDWGLMAHGIVFGQVVFESDDVHRTGGFSGQQASSVNWGMFMARRRVGDGRLGLRGMFSAEQWTVSDCGFIDYFATGEMCEGDTIHDRQHPHDLVMEIAADYERPLTSKVRWQIYGGPAGEPALGPPAFPHRPSAALNPVAPIGHHWIDSTHISYGVLTAGIRTARWNVEGSIFNGREPDEDRADLDLGPLDSYSGRISFVPSPRVVVQVSAGHLEEAEAQFAPSPRTDVERFSASVLVTRPVGGSGVWALTTAYGANAGWIELTDRAVERVSHALLIESSLTLAGGHNLFARVEAVGKPGHDLHVHEFPARVLPTSKLEAGYAREWPAGAWFTAGLGATASVSIVPEEMIPRYYGRFAPSFGVFGVLRPRHRM